jgi:hypothetical protein
MVPRQPVEEECQLVRFHDERSRFESGSMWVAPEAFSAFKLHTGKQAKENKRSFIVCSEATGSNFYTKEGASPPSPNHLHRNRHRRGRKQSVCRRASPAQGRVAQPACQRKGAALQKSVTWLSVSCTGGAPTDLPPRCSREVVAPELAQRLIPSQAPAPPRQRCTVGMWSAAAASGGPQVRSPARGSLPTRAGLERAAARRKLLTGRRAF